MTFDARSSTGSAGDRGNLIFGGLILLVVGAAFFLTFKGPDLFSAGAKAPKVAAASTDDALHKAFSDQTSRAYFKALRAADSVAYADLEKKVARNPDASEREMRQVIMEHSEVLVKRNAHTLAKADARHMDAMIGLMRQGLKSADRSGSKFCKGSFYAGMSKMGPKEAERFARNIIDLEGPVYEFGLKANTVLAEAIADAKANPVKHGKVNSRDEAAMQGVMMSLMADPQIMPLLMSGNGSSDPEALLRKLDVCKLGDSVLVAVKTLPQDTKGRVWAAAMDEATSANPFSKMQGFRGF